MEAAVFASMAGKKARAKTVGAAVFASMAGEEARAKTVEEKVFERLRMAVFSTRGVRVAIIFAFRRMVEQHA